MSEMAAVVLTWVELWKEVEEVAQEMGPTFAGIFLDSTLNLYDTRIYDWGIVTYCGDEEVGGEL